LCKLLVLAALAAAASAAYPTTNPGSYRWIGANMGFDSVENWNSSTTPMGTTISTKPCNTNVAGTTLNFVQTVLLDKTYNVGQYLMLPRNGVLVMSPSNTVLSFSSSSACAGPATWIGGSKQPTESMNLGCHKNWEYLAPTVGASYTAPPNDVPPCTMNQVIFDVQPRSKVSGGQAYFGGGPIKMFIPSNMTLIAYQSIVLINFDNSVTNITSSNVTGGLTVSSSGAAELNIDGVSSINVPSLWIGLSAGIINPKCAANNQLVSNACVCWSTCESPAQSLVQYNVNVSVNKAAQNASFYQIVTIPFTGVMSLSSLGIFQTQLTQTAGNSTQFSSLTAMLRSAIAQSYGLPLTGINLNAAFNITLSAQGIIQVIGSITGPVIDVYPNFQNLSTDLITWDVSQVNNPNKIVYTSPIEKIIMNTLTNEILAYSNLITPGSAATQIANNIPQNYTLQGSVYFSSSQSNLRLLIALNPANYEKFAAALTAGLKNSDFTSAISWNSNVTIALVQPTLTKNYLSGSFSYTALCKSSDSNCQRKLEADSPWQGNIMASNFLYTQIEEAFNLIFLNFDFNLPVCVCDTGLNVCTNAVCGTSVSTPKSMCNNCNAIIGGGACLNSSTYISASESLPFDTAWTLLYQDPGQQQAVQQQVCSPPLINACSCPGGTATVSTGSGSTLCATNGATDCSSCSSGFTLSATAGLGAQSCVPNICTCPLGTGVVSAPGGSKCVSSGSIMCASCYPSYTLTGGLCIGNPCTTDFNASKVVGATFNVATFNVSSIGGANTVSGGTFSFTCNAGWSPSGVAICSLGVWTANNPPCTVTPITPPAASASASGDSGIVVIAAAAGGGAILIVVVVVLMRKRRGRGQVAGLKKPDDRVVVAFENPMYQEAGQSGASTHQDGLYSEVGKSSGGLYEEPSFLQQNKKHNPIYMEGAEETTGAGYLIVQNQKPTSGGYLDVDANAVGNQYVEATTGAVGSEYVEATTGAEYEYQVTGAAAKKAESEPLPEYASPYSDEQAGGSLYADLTSAGF